MHESIMDKLREAEVVKHNVWDTRCSISLTPDEAICLRERLEKLEVVAEAARHYIDHLNTPTEDYNYNCEMARTTLENTLQALKGKR